MIARLNQYKIFLFAFFLSLIFWIIALQKWWFFLDGDCSLYPVMSFEVLKGKHFWMTAGQSHGGTFLVYLRAGLYKVFGITPVLGFLPNALAVAIANGLWSQFLGKKVGTCAGVVFAFLGGIVSMSFIRYATTDYYAMTLLVAGIGFFLADWASNQKSLNPKSLFGLGVFLGLSYYLCPFSAIYHLGSFLILVLSLPIEIRKVWIPTFSELWNSNRIPKNLSRLLIVVTGSCLFIFITSFFFNDKPFGLNAEQALRISVKYALLLWILHQRVLLIQYLKKFSVFIFGYVFGLMPEIIFILTQKTGDRMSGIVRFNQFYSEIQNVIPRMSYAYSNVSANTFGIASVISLLFLLIWSVLNFKKASSDHKKMFLGFSFLFVLSFGAWVCIRTYMYLVPQYYFSAIFPLFALAAIAVEWTKVKEVAIALVLVILISSLADLRAAYQSINPFEQSHVLETLNRFGVTDGFGRYPSSYNLMYAYNGAIKLGWPNEEDRFPEFAEKARSMNKTAYVFNEKDRGVPYAIPGFNVVEDIRLGFGYRAQLLQKNIEYKP